MNAWPAITTNAVRSRLRPRIGRSLALSRPWSASTRLLAYWLVSWCAPGSSSTIVRANAGDRSVVTSAGRAEGVDRRREEPGRRLHIAFGGNHSVDDLPVLVDGAVHIPPGAGHLHVGLINEPPVPDSVAARPSRVDDQRREPLHPPGHCCIYRLRGALAACSRRGSRFRLHGRVRRKQRARSSQGVLRGRVRSGLVAGSS